MVQGTEPSLVSSLITKKSSICGSKRSWELWQQWHRAAPEGMLFLAAITTRFCSKLS